MTYAELTLSMLWIAGVLMMTTVLFVLARNLILWYFKINEHLANQRRIIALLEKSAGEGIDE